jgi:hypothetical protein
MLHQRELKRGIRREAILSFITHSQKTEKSKKNSLKKITGQEGTTSAQ